MSRASPFETAALIGLVVPGEAAVLLGGVVARSGEVSPELLVILVWVAAVAGDVASLLLGRRVGPEVLRRWAFRLGVPPEQLMRAEEFLVRRGGKAILFGRFVGVLRPVVAFVAGSTGLSLRRMLPYSVLGALAWSTILTAAGYAFAGSFESAGELMTRISFALGVVIVLTVAARRRVATHPRLRRRLPLPPPHTGTREQ